MSEHTIHSSSVSLSCVGDVLDGVIQGSLQIKNKINKQNPICQKLQNNTKLRIIA